MGHFHNNEVKKDTGEIDPRYFNVSVERINYIPISLEEIKKISKNRLEGSGNY